MSSIDKEDLEEINNLRVELARVVSEAGQLSVQIKLLEEELKELNSRLEPQVLKFKGLLNEEQTLVKRLSDKYGAGKINFETGELT